MKWITLQQIYITKFVSEEVGIQKTLTVVKEPKKVIQELPWPSLPMGRKSDKSLKIYVQYSLNYFRAQRGKKKKAPKSIFEVKRTLIPQLDKDNKF